MISTPFAPDRAKSVVEGSSTQISPTNKTDRSHVAGTRSRFSRLEVLVIIELLQPSSSAGVELIAGSLITRGAVDTLYFAP